MSTAVIDAKPKVSLQRRHRKTALNSPEQFRHYQTELIRLQKLLQMERKRGDDARADALCDERLNAIVTMAQEISELQCADLHQLHVKMQFVREFCDGDGIIGKLVLSMCGDIDVLWRCGEVTRKSLNSIGSSYDQPAKRTPPAKRNTKRKE